MKAGISRNANGLRRIVGGALIYFCGLLLECRAILPLYTHFTLLRITVPELVILHTTANLVMAGALCSILPQKYQTNFFGALACFFLLGLFVPILGSVGLLLVYCFGIRCEKQTDAKEKFWQVIPPAGLPDRVPDVAAESRFGSNGMQSRLRKTERLGAQLGIVLATRFMRDENAVPLLSTALANPADDVRLLAFSLLEKKIAEISARIEQLQLRLEREDHTDKIHLVIAQNYLRLVTLELIQDEMKLQALTKARRHLRKAMAQTSSDGACHFLLGQVLLEQGKVDQAEAAFLRALECGFAAGDVYPFLSKAAYLRRQFQKIYEYKDKIPMMTATNR